MITDLPIFINTQYTNAHIPDNNPDPQTYIEAIIIAGLYLNIVVFIKGRLRDLSNF